MRWSAYPGTGRGRGVWRNGSDDLEDGAVLGRAGRDGGLVWIFEGRYGV